MINETGVISDIFDSLAFVVLAEPVGEVVAHSECVLDLLSLANEIKTGNPIKLDGTLSPSRFGVRDEVKTVVSCMLDRDYITAHRAAERLQMLLTKA